MSFHPISHLCWEGYEPHPSCVCASVSQAQVAAVKCIGVTNTLKSMKNMSINQRILATPGSEILFGPYSSAALVIFAPTDAAWMAAVKAMGAPFKFHIQKEDYRLHSSLE